jgi:urea transporter
MIPYPDNTPVERHGSLASALLRGLPRGYAVVFFSTDVRLGWVLLALSLTMPVVGVAGLGGALLAGLVAWGLGFDRAGIRSGFQLFNPMLACSAVVLLHSGREVPLAVMILLWAGAAVMALLLTVSIQPWFGARSGLSVQSLPAVITVYVMHFASSALDVGWPWLPVGELPVWAARAQPGGWFEPMLESFGGMVFHPLVWIGIAVFVALAISSPLGALMAAVGWLAGTGTLVLLGQPVAHAGGAAVGFNFLLAGLALGAGYHVPNRSSLLLAACGASLCALLAVGMGAALGRFGLAPGALPFNGAVLLVVYALRQWPRSAGLEPSPLGTLLPESAARLVQLDARRFPHLHTPALFLPVDSERLITQDSTAT